MKQLLLFAIIGTGIVGMSVGFASNTIALNVQQLGVGENFIQTPVKNADVDFELAKVQRSVDNIANNGDDYFVNLITACSFHTAQDIPGPATVICKLTDNRNDVKNADGTVTQHFGGVIAEGRTFLPTGYVHDTKLIIPIVQTIYPDANDVQNIHDVKIVVKGIDPTRRAAGP